MLHHSIQYECYTVQHGPVRQELTRQGLEAGSRGGARTCENPGYYTVDPVVAGSSPVALAKRKRRKDKTLRRSSFLPSVHAPQDLGAKRAWRCSRWCLGSAANPCFSREL